MSLWQQITQWFSHQQPLPDAWQGKLLQDIPVLAIDLELTSLDVNKAKIISFGWVEGQAGSIDLDSCFYDVVRASGSLEQSPVIHGLTEEHLAQGNHVKDALLRLAPMANTHVWVFHNAGLDTGVLNSAMAKNDIQLDNIVTLDTLKLAVYQLQKQHQVLPNNSATLTVCRQRLDLPAAPAHNALDDAMATLQLLFAQLIELGGMKNVRIDDLLHTQALSVINLGKKVQKGD